jgi:hypothetical protein
VIVVADAGPILHLHWIGCLSWGLPPTPIHVVEQVWLEITQHAPQALDDPRLERNPNRAAACCPISVPSGANATCRNSSCASASM